MTISTQTSAVTIIGNSAATEFDFAFLIPTADDLVVTLTELATLNAQTLDPSVYAVIGLGEADGGAVTYPLAGAPITSAYSLTIQRVLPLEQTADIINQSAFYTEVVEAALDYLMMAIQQVFFETARSLKAPIGVAVDTDSIIAAINADAASAAASAITATAQAVIAAAQAATATAQAAIATAQAQLAAAGLINASVRVATTGNVVIATALNNGDTIDGVVLAAGDRVLVKSQTAPAENGIYVVGVSPARATDFDTWAEFPGTIINVSAGTANANLSFRCTVNAGGTLNTTAITYIQFGSSLSLPLAIANGGIGSGVAATGFDNLKQNATTAYVGAVELLTAAEFRTGTDTTRALTADAAWSALAEVTLTDAGTVAVDLATFINGVVTLGGNRTLGNPTNTKAGQAGRIRIVQDGTGSRTLAFAANWEFVNAQAPLLSTAAGAEDVLSYDVISATRVLASLSRGIG